MNGHAYRARLSLLAVASILLWIVLGSLAFVPQAGAASNTITGRVFWDPNENNHRDAGETLVSGVRVSLDLPGGGQLSATTGSDGSYRFTDLDNGIYTFTLTPPSSTWTNPQFGYLALNSSITQEFGLVPYECRWTGLAAKNPCPTATTQPPDTTTTPPTTKPATVTTRTPVTTSTPLTTTPPVSGTASLRTNSTTATTAPAGTSPNTSRTVTTTPAVVAGTIGSTTGNSASTTPGDSTASTTPAGTPQDLTDNGGSPTTVTLGGAGGATSETTVLKPLDELAQQERATQVGGEDIDKPVPGQPVLSGELAIGEVSEPTNVIERVPTIYWAIIGIALLAVILTLLIAAPDLTRKSAPVTSEGSGSLLGEHTVRNAPTQDSNWHAD